MAVQKSKKSPSKRNMRRSHDRVESPSLSVEASTGETHIRHHISPSGYYRGKKIFDIKVKKEKNEAES